MAGTFVSLSVNINLADLHPSSIGIQHLLKRKRNHFAIVETNDGAVFSRIGRKQKFHGGIAEITRVFGIEGDRIGATQFVTQVFVEQRDLYTELLQALGQ